MRYGFKNFYVSTIANFSLCEIPDRSPDFISFSGSVYWDFGYKVRRYSNHWGKVASCYWLLEFEPFYAKNYGLCGECYYDDFRIFTIGGPNMGRVEPESDEVELKQFRPDQKDPVLKSDDRSTIEDDTVVGDNPPVEQLEEPKE